MKDSTLHFFLFFLVVSCLTQLSTSLTPDGLALLSLKSAVDQSTAASAFSDWADIDASPCRWTGISYMNITGLPDLRVVEIALAAKSLRGYIPSELGNLVYLRRLNLHNNDFYDAIPSQLFNATSLHSLFLHGNNLSGNLPSSICNLSRIQNVDLSNNSLSDQLVAIDKRFTFELDELLRVSAYVLGKSGLGIVYKVVLGNGIPVAMRRLGEGGDQRYKEFAVEVQAIRRVKHPNVVRLRAYYWRDT